MWIETGIQKFETEKYSEAVADFSQALQIQPYDALALAWRGRCRFKLEDYAKALQDYDEALNLTQNAQLYYERGLVRFFLKQAKSSLADFDRAAALEPHNPFRYSSRAYVKAAWGMLPEAVSDYEQAIALDPEDAVAYNNMGLLQEQMGYMEAAKKSFKTADELVDGVAFTPKSSTSQAEMLPTEAIQKSPTLWSIMRQTLSSRQGWKEFSRFWMERVKGSQRKQV